MALAQQDIEQIQLLINKSLAESPVGLNANVRYELDLRERTIRVEEELKHQREMMAEGFKQMEKRIEQVQWDMNKRFEQVDKRIEQVDKRIELLQLDMNKRFEQMDKRFEQMDKRFEQVDKRFEQQHQEVMGLHHEIKLLMRWSFGTLLAVGSLIVAMLKFTH
jgi:uncharacterized protein (DUF3084 family)